MLSERLDSPPPEKLWTLTALRDIREEIDRQAEALQENASHEPSGAAESSSTPEGRDED